MADMRAAVEVEMRGLPTSTAVMPGDLPEGVRGTISASAMMVPGLGERVAVTIITGDGRNAVALLDGNVFSAFGSQMIEAGEKAALLAAQPTGKAN